MIIFLVILNDDSFKYFFDKYGDDVPVLARSRCALSSWDPPCDPKIDVFCRLNVDQCVLMRIAVQTLIDVNIHD